MQERIQKLNMYLKGWSGSSELRKPPTPFKSLDEWIRRRLRMCLLK
ncbi:group II intron maturase-specific domain-containing protein, partial [Tumebacillus flagellatus]